jgi:hypothetical protein
MESRRDASRQNGHLCLTRDALLYLGTLNIEDAAAVTEAHAVVYWLDFDYSADTGAGETGQWQSGQPAPGSLQTQVMATNGAARHPIAKLFVILILRDHVFLATVF